MAVPRVFISSTYYDLKQVRDDIDVFIQSIGYEPVRHERSKVPYTQSGPLEDDCYREIATCDIVVCIIGKEYGSESEHEALSVTMKELNTAFDEHKLVYVFVDRDVMCENRIYQKNAGKDITPGIVSDVRIHKYIADLEKRIGRQRPIFKFERAQEIIDQLRDQLAGKFLRLLQKEVAASAAKNAYDLHTEIEEFKDLVSAVRTDHESFRNAFSSTVLVRNPILKTIESKLGIFQCSFLVPNKSALDELLSALGFTAGEGNDSAYVYSRQIDGKEQTLTVSHEVFDDSGMLVLERNAKKRESLVGFSEQPLTVDDGMPF